MAYDDLCRIPTKPLPPARPVEVAGPGAAPILAERLADLTDELENWPGALYQLGETQLTQFVATMLRLSVRAESLAATATTEAVQRGAVASSQATDAAGWVAQVASGAEPGVARRVGAVATGCADPRNQCVTDAVAAGAVSVSCAYVALREAPKVLPVIPSAEREEILSWYLALADSGSRALRALTTRIVGRFAPDELVRDEARQQACESLRWSDLPNGLTQLVAELSAGHAAEVKHAIQALAAPAPSACAPAVDSTNSGTSEPGGSEVGNARTPGK